MYREGLCTLLSASLIYFKIYFAPIFNILYNMASYQNQEIGSHHQYSPQVFRFQQLYVQCVRVSVCVAFCAVLSHMQIHEATTTMKIQNCTATATARVLCASFIATPPFLATASNLLTCSESFQSISYMALFPFLKPPAGSHSE